MSYCRFSSDDHASDIYCYESVGDFFAIHVAGNRLVPREPLPPKVTLTKENVPAWIERDREVGRILDVSPRVEIGLPHDGAFFQEPDAASCADRLEYLRGIGYNVPQYAIDALREEAAAPANNQGSGEE